MFEYLTEIDGNKDDSFIKCVSIVFDSDTCYEFNSKLDSLIKACVCFVDGKLKEALDEVELLNSTKHKKVTGIQIASLMCGVCSDGNLYNFDSELDKKINYALCYMVISKIAEAHRIE